MIGFLCSYKLFTIYCICINIYTYTYNTLLIGYDDRKCSIFILMKFERNQKKCNINYKRNINNFSSNK